MESTGQINGIKSTGVNHMDRIFQFLLVDVKTKYQTNGIIVNIGIFVRIANPKKIPESNIMGMFLLVLIL